MSDSSVVKGEEFHLEETKLFLAFDEASLFNNLVLSLRQYL